jgi:hypothetical protein
MAEQRYSDDEVREIFERAASKERLTAPRTSEPDGFTLGELQSIGREAGLDPARIAEAASSLEARRGALPRRTTWGMPVAVGRVVDLPRAPTDREWEMLVAELRNTFGARGRASSQGNLREWRNGNLVVAVEPTESGYRLRLGTMKGDAGVMNVMGVVGMAVAAASMLPASVVDGSEALVFGAMGIVALVANYVRLPRWADKREQQMEYVAGRVQGMLRSDPKIGEGDKGS